MTVIQKIHVADGVGVFLVTFGEGDPLTSDDATTTPMDYISIPFGPILDKHMAGWRGRSLYLATSIMPANGSAIPDGKNKTGPSVVASCGHTQASNVWTFSTTIDLNKNPEPTVELDLIASTIADGVLDEDSAHRILITVGPKHGGDKSPFDSLPQTATANGA